MLRMPKRLTALLTALVMLLCACTALGETAKSPVEETAEMMSYLHFSFVSMVMVPDVYADEEACFNDMVLLELTGHSYPYTAYRSHDSIWDAVFIPDSSGQKIASVQLLADAGNSQLGDYRICQRAAAHALGLCSPYWLNEDATVFINDFISIYTQALSLPSGQETSAVSYNGVQVSCYRNNGTFGIILTYPAPVDNNALFSNSVVTALMLSAINQE